MCERNCDAWAAPSLQQHEQHRRSSSHGSCSVATAAALPRRESCGCGRTQCCLAAVPRHGTSWCRAQRLAKRTLAACISAPVPTATPVSQHRFRLHLHWMQAADRVCVYSPTPDDREADGKVVAGRLWPLRSHSQISLCFRLCPLQVHQVQSHCRRQCRHSKACLLGSAAAAWLR